MSADSRVILRGIALGRLAGSAARLTTGRSNAQIVVGEELEDGREDKEEGKAATRVEGRLEARLAATKVVGRLDSRAHAIIAASTDTESANAGIRTKR